MDQTDKRKEQKFPLIVQVQTSRVMNFCIWRLDVPRILYNIHTTECNSKTHTPLTKGDPHLLVIKWSGSLNFPTPILLCQCLLLRYTGTKRCNVVQYTGIHKMCARHRRRSRAITWMKQWLSAPSIRHVSELLSSRFSWIQVITKSSVTLYSSHTG